jgi:flagellar protein FlbD
MIQLTRFSGQGFVLNCEYIKFVEETPDTIITLRDGEKVIVKESAEEVVERAVRYARSIRMFPDLA